VSAHRLVFSVLAAVLGVLVFASAPALAAPLEAPGLTVESIAATTATLHGVLNPKGESGAGTYEFLYRQGKAGCTGGTRVPVPAGLMMGLVEEQEYEGIAGLVADTEYMACVRVVNTTSSPSEEATSPAVTFTTAIPPETPVVVNPVKSVTATSATLEGVLNPGAAGNAGAFEFVYKASATGCEGGEAFYGVASGGKEEVVKDEATLLPYTAYTVCLRAYNDAGEVSGLSSPVTFMTSPSAPVIESESSANMDATEVRLQATIDPENSQTSYHFEYGPAAGSYNAVTPVREIKAGLTGTEVDAVLTGLNPGSTYHYRVVASNALPGTVDGTDESVTTPAAQTSGSPSVCPNEELRGEQSYALELPDCRAYEMVSPVETNGSDATDWFDFSPSRAAVSGESVTYASFGDFADAPGSAFENQFLSRRGTDGWSTQGITPLHHTERGDPTDSSFGTGAFTPELTEGLASTNASLTGEFPGRQLEFGLYDDDFANSTYRYVGKGKGQPATYAEGTSTDLSHIVLGSEIVVGESGATVIGAPEEISEWVNGKVVRVNVTNKGESLEGYLGDGFVHQARSTREALWRAVSADGSRAYFTSGGNLYLRENAEQPQSPVGGSKEECVVSADACTVEVSTPQAKVVDPNGPQPASYWDASTNGSRVFFTSNAELTEDAYTGPADNAANLYEYDLERPAGERLKDLAVDRTDADGAAVQAVVQTSEDGSYVYFVADGDLGGRAAAGEPNLYVSHDDGAPVFIATLAANDEPSWSPLYGPSENNAVVSPDGSRLAFVSEQSLTGYDNEQAEPRECENEIDKGSTQSAREKGKCGEIYLYDAVTNVLVCTSCNPTGARPTGPSRFSRKDGPEDFNLYRPRNLLENGELFFDSSDALVPHASDGRENVYEYENGHVYPISDVAGGYESFFMDAGANGDNVFFATADRLLPQDTSNNVVVYDARVEGGFPVSGSPPSCDNGDSCKPPPVPQPGVFGAPGSAAFSGPGNIKPAQTISPAAKTKAKSVKCKKGYVKKKGKCVKKAKKKRVKKSSDRKRSR
jgi:WD40 repeat protein